MTIAVMISVPGSAECHPKHHPEHKAAKIFESSVLEIIWSHLLWQRA